MNPGNPRSPEPLTDMYVVTEAGAAAIREVYEAGGELSAAITRILAGLVFLTSGGWARTSNPNSQPRRELAIQPYEQTPTRPTMVQSKLAG